MALIVGGADRASGAIPRRDRRAARRVLRRAVRRRRRRRHASPRSSRRVSLPRRTSTPSPRSIGARSMSPTRRSRTESLVASAREWRGATRGACSRVRGPVDLARLGAGVRSARRGAGEVGIGARTPAAGGMTRLRSSAATLADVAGDRRDRARGVQRSVVGRSFRDALVASVGVLRVRASVTDETSLVMLSPGSSPTKERSRISRSRRAGGGAESDARCSTRRCAKRRRARLTAVYLEVRDSNDARAASLRIARIRGDWTETLVLPAAGGGCHRATADADDGDV